MYKSKYLPSIYYVCVPVSHILLSETSEKRERIIVERLCNLFSIVCTWNNGKGWWRDFDVWIHPVPNRSLNNVYRNQKSL